MAATPSLEECRAFLSEACEQPDGKEKSVLDHLSQLLLKVLEEKPSNALDLFEQISSEVKKQPKGGSMDVPAPPNANKGWATSIEGIVGPPKEPAEGEEVPPENVDCKITNLVQEAAMFDAAGVGAGLTRINAVPLYLGMKKLANKEPLQSVRLFGKIMGTRGIISSASASTLRTMQSLNQKVGKRCLKGRKQQGLRRSPWRTPRQGSIHMCTMWPGGSRERRGHQEAAMTLRTGPSYLM